MTTSAVCAVEHAQFRFISTGKERDQESGNDYFGFRYYSSTMGRWLSPDPSGLAFASPFNPQSLNLYAYALNNPLRFKDLNGLYCYYGDTDVDSAQYQQDIRDPSQFDYHSSQSECETLDENGNSGEWINDDETHQTPDGDWVDNDDRPEGYTIYAGTTPSPAIQNQVEQTLGDVQFIGVDLPNIQQYTARDVFKWAAQGIHIPNGPMHPIQNPGGVLYWHGNWCGAGGSGTPVDTTDAACMVHDFLYAMYGYTAGDNLNGYNPGLQEINQGLCDTAGSAAITAYFNFGVQSLNLDPTNINNPSCK